MAEKSEKSGTTPTRWDPFRELDELRDRIWRSMGPLQERLSGGPWSPLADVEEKDDAFVIEAELPGVERENITIEASDGEIAITGEVEERERKGVLRTRTRRTGHYEYRLSLPADIDPAKVEATLEKGVLTVTAPKKEPAPRTRIEVKTT